MNLKKVLFFFLAVVGWTFCLTAQNAWINEIHYDNVGTDVGEFIEVVVQNAGTYTLSDFTVILYNGSGGASYNTKTLDLFTLGSTVSGYTFYYYTFPSNGIQNGSPDGMALSYQGTLVTGQFLSYEGTFTATNGPANGATSVDIGVSETTSTPIGQSLQLGGTGGAYAAFTWEAPQAETPGNLNVNQSLTGAIDPEPTNYPTNFLATPGIFAVDLNWTDATGTQLPSAYLILASDADNIALPVDGTPVADDPDLSDGTAALNISQGVEAAIFENLPSNVLYYFKIFPYTNAGATIDYKTDGTPPSDTATTPDFVIINEEDFNGGTLGTWTQISVTGAQTWSMNMTNGVGGTPCAYMNGYSGGAVVNEDWLISPSMYFNHYTQEHFRFQTAKNYTGPDLQVLISNDYAGTGDPNLATWTALSPTLCSGGWAWTPSGWQDVSTTDGSDVYLAFKYTSTSSAAAAWEVDEILVVGVPDFYGPTVVTEPNVTNLTNVSATAGGDVTDDGGSAIIARGICYGTALNPSLNGQYTVEPGTTGPFTSDITGLTSQTTYHIRAYATSAIGTSYGSDETFTTLCDPLAPIADFYASTTTIMVGETIDFFDASEYCPDAWNWSFVGGVPMSSNDTNPQNIMWEYPGVYNICLTVTNAYGEDVECKMGYITVNAPVEADIVITEIMYNPPESGTDSLEFIELYNNDTQQVNLENFYFSKGVTFAFPAYTLNPGDYVIVAESAQAMLNTFGVTVLEWTDGALNNGGEEIVLNEPMGNVIDSVTYGDLLPWDTLADGWGPSLELCDPGSNNALPENWRHALEFAAINTAGDTIWASPLEGCSYPPVADFSADDTSIVVGGAVTFTDASTGNIDYYEWTFEGGDPATFTGAAPPPVQYNDMGTFDVSLKVTNSAGQNTLTRVDYIEVGSTSVASSVNEVSFNIYPNPVSQDYFILLLPHQSRYKISLLTQLGYEFFGKEISMETMKIPVSGVAAGFYFIRVTDLNNGKSGIRKVVIQ
ncbi:MAG: lamin tail domain-containing protein [Bacteroidales bacterium]|nr:lamin tail domain-containing protein [Bacteroidales bacterium]